MNTQTLARPMRIWFLLDSIIVLIAGVQLIVLADFTQLYFAWTITPALSAMFLGGGYWASVPLLYFSARQTIWARARLGVFGVLVFTILTLVVTVMHLDRFHLASAAPTALIAAWIWLITYSAVPLILIALLIWQRRAPGGEPARAAPLSVWFRVVLALQGAIMLGVGSALFIAPTGVAWMWTLTPLTGRAIAAWLIGIGVIAIHASWENDWQRIGGAMLGWACFGGLQMLALIRYASTVDWSAPVTLFSLGFLASQMVIGGYGWQRARRSAASRENSNTFIAEEK